MMQMMQDPQIQQQLQQQGITIGQQGPQGPDGQVIPPEQMAQILQQITGGGAPGGQPPQGGGAPGPDGGTPMTLEMFQALMPQYLASKDGGHEGHQTTKERLNSLEEMVHAIAAKIGMSPAEMGAGQEVAPPEQQAPMDPAMAQQPPPPPQDPAAAGMTPEAQAAAEQPKMASEAPSRRDHARQLQKMINTMRQAR
jgi:hypothetical protein